MKLEEITSSVVVMEKTTNNYEETLAIIKSWQNISYSMETLKIQQDGSIVDNKSRFVLKDSMLIDGYFPIKLQSVKMLSVMSSDLKSFINFPDQIIGNKGLTSSLFFSIFNKHLTSLAGLNIKSVDGAIDFSLLLNLKLSNIHKHIKSLNGELVIPQHYKGPLLGVLNIANLKRVTVHTSGKEQPALDIINDYIQSGNKDIIACQEELIEAGLKDYAKL
jgi:hypothetical protein